MVSGRGGSFYSASQEVVCKLEKEMPQFASTSNEGYGIRGLVQT